MLQLHKLIILVLCQSLLFSPVAYANFDRATEIYSSGDFKEAKSAFEALAAIGDRSSLFNLGVMYYRGEAVERDPIKGYIFMKIANDGLDDESFARVISSILGSFNNTEKAAAEKLFLELNPVYNIAAINANIFPEPLDDEDCPPEIEPIKKTIPEYPLSENIAGRMGLTHIELTVSPEGYPRDVVVAKSTNKVFARTSRIAIKQTLYRPALDGKPVYGHRTTFIYQIGARGAKEVDVRTKNLTKELDELETAADNGDVVAQYQYATRLNTFRHFKSYLKKVDLQYRTANHWFAKSAEAGLPHSQYEIGRNMIKGRGCAVDVVNGYKWINAAAISGFSPAQRALAQSALLESDISAEKSLGAIGWLRNAAHGNDFPAKLLLAWELSTSNIKEFRDSAEALELLESDTDNYFDELRVVETKAAAYAEHGNFKKAIKLQKKAIKIAKKLNWDIPLISERLSLYEDGQSYRGSYY